MFVEARISHLRRWGHALALLALVARCSIPVGFMPDFGAAADGFFRLVICSSASQFSSSPNDISGSSLPDDKQSGQRDDAHHCPFAGHGRDPGLAALTPTIAFAPIVALMGLADYPSEPASCGVLACGPPLPSRGPPLSL